MSEVKMSESEYEECIEIMEEFDNHMNTWGTSMMINGAIWSPSALLLATDQTKYIATMLTWIAGGPNAQFERVKKTSGTRTARGRKTESRRCH